MNAHPISAPEGKGTLRDVATRWIVRQDRGLTKPEAAELERWLATDARHAAALEEAKASWQFFRELGTVVRRAPDVRPQRRWPVAAGLAAAAALAIAFLAFERSHAPAARVAERSTASRPVLAAAQTLSDGSIVRLKDDARITAAFSVTERRIRLERGEAFFTVAKDAVRPFLVEAGGATVRAVGTAFAVRCGPQAVDVVVTEGVVQVISAVREAATQTAAGAPAPAVVSAGNRAIVTRTPGGAVAPVEVRAISAAEIERTLAWSGRMLELDGATLGELVAEFSRRSGRRLEVADHALAAVRIGGRFPTDDVDGFVRALEEVYHVSSERRSDGAIVLKPRPAR